MVTRHRELILLTEGDTLSRVNRNVKEPSNLKERRVLLSEWEQNLGLIPSPLFSAASTDEWAPRSDVMLDGKDSSFVLIHCDDLAEDKFSDIRDLIWSSNHYHSIIVKREGLYYLNLESHSIPTRIPMPNEFFEYQDLLTSIKKLKSPRTKGVVSFVLKAFDQVRSLLEYDNENALLLFNALLLYVSKEQESKPSRITGAKITPQDIFDSLSKIERGALNWDSFDGGESQLLPINDIIRLFFTPFKGLRLIPSLLVRHGAGELYQNAHLVIERDFKQKYFPAQAPSKTRGGKLKRDIRFTPVQLARSLIREALSQNKQILSKKIINVLDPACGSGVFLTELIKELEHFEYSGTARLVGIDSSSISCKMSKFCLFLAEQELGNSPFGLEYEILCSDSLLTDWGSPDLILMNPPFVSIEHLEKDDKKLARKVLGQTAIGRIDLSMAFILNACKTLSDSGIIASVLPASLYSTLSGKKWREEIQTLVNLQLIGRFNSFTYMPYSLVETGFIIGRSRHSLIEDTSKELKILVANSGYEDEALRINRLPDVRKVLINISKPKHIDIYSIKQTQLNPEDWKITFESDRNLPIKLEQAGFVNAEELFSIHQGIRSGLKSAFVVSRGQYNRFDKTEKSFFKPTAGTKSIRNSRLQELWYIFYPYDAQGNLLIRNEKELKFNLRKHYVTLEKHMPALAKRPHAKKGPWWKLSDPAKWQIRGEPKLVSKSFGRENAFAFDEYGEYVVQQGFAWMWKKSNSLPFDQFVDLGLFFAYLALFNSTGYQAIFSAACPITAGGQFQLDVKYVKKLKIPNLADEISYSSELVDALIRIGKSIHEGSYYDEEQHNDVISDLIGPYLIDY